MSLLAPFKKFFLRIGAVISDRDPHPGEAFPWETPRAGATPPHGFSGSADLDGAQARESHSRGALASLPCLAPPHLRTGCLKYCTIPLIRGSQGGQAPRRQRGLPAAGWVAYGDCFFMGTEFQLRKTKTTVEMGAQQREYT